MGRYCLNVYKTKNIKNNWSAQVEATLKKCNSLLYLLGRIKTFLNLSTRKLYFSAYILPHLDYCCTSWGNCNNYLLDKLIKFQKRAARLILDKDIDTLSAELFQQLDWMNFDERVTYRKAGLMYKSLHNLAPTYLSNKFTYTSSIHQVNIRSLTDSTLYVPEPNIKSEIRYFKSSENINKKEGGSYYVVSANKASSVTL